MNSRQKKKKETFAAGVLIFKESEDQIIKYLLVQNKRKEWSPPKGHLNLLESYLDAAIREVEEETGLKEGTDYQICYSREPVFKTQYLDKSHRNPKLKNSYYFLGKIINHNYQVKLCPHELISFGWFNSQEAKQKMKHYKEMADLIDYYQ